MGKYLLVNNICELLSVEAEDEDGDNWTRLDRTLVNILYTVPKTMQISECTGEEVPWSGNFPVNLGN